MIRCVEADGNAAMWIRVEAPGYNPFEIRVRGKANKNKFMDIPVMMEKLEDWDIG